MSRGKAETKQGPKFVHSNLWVNPGIKKAENAPASQRGEKFF